MGKFDQDRVKEAIAVVTQGQRTGMKAVLSALEEQFDGVALIAMDVENDTLLYGFDYVDSEEASSSCACSSGDGHGCACGCKDEVRHDRSN